MQPSSVSCFHVLDFMKPRAAATFPLGEGKDTEIFLCCRIPKVIILRDF